MQDGRNDLCDRRGASQVEPTQLDGEGDQESQGRSGDGLEAICAQELHPEVARYLWDRLRNLQIWWGIQEGNAKPVLENVVPGAGMEELLLPGDKEHQPAQDDTFHDEGASDLAESLGAYAGIDHMLYVIGHDRSICPCPECDLDREQEARAL